jgi:casein kinase II subunit beta
MDRFNLTGLNGEVVQEYTRALDLLTDCSGMSSYTRPLVVADCVDEADLDDDARETIETSARFLYGLIHARYIVTSRGLGKMVRL